jgi:hypothetical protein
MLSPPEISYTGSSPLFPCTSLAPAMSGTAQRCDFHDQPADYARLAQELGAL